MHRVGYVAETSSALTRSSQRGLENLPLHLSHLYSPPIHKHSAIVPEPLQQSREIIVKLAPDIQVPHDLPMLQICILERLQCLLSLSADRFALPARVERVVGFTQPVDEVLLRLGFFGDQRTVGGVARGQARFEEGLKVHGFQLAEGVRALEEGSFGEDAGC